MKLEAGRYAAKGTGEAAFIEAAEEGKADQIAVKLRVFRSDEDEEGVELTSFLFFSDKATPHSIGRLRVMGWDGDSLADLTGIDRNTFEVDVSYEMYNGQEKLRIQIVSGGGGVSLERQMDDTKKRAFAAKYAHLTKRAPTAPAAAAPKRVVNGGKALF